MGKQWKKSGKILASQAKGAQFTKIAKEIAVAARLGGPDPNSNSRLRMAIDAAKRNSCGKEMVDRAIRRGAGLDNEQIIEEIIYEGYAPHGVGIIVECQTDNRNRTASELRFLFKSHNGNMGESGSVAWMFERVALVEAKKSPPPKDPEEDAIEVGANSVEVSDDNVLSFYGATGDLDPMKKALTERGFEILNARFSFLAKETTKITEAQQEEVVALLEALEENEDISHVHATLE